MTLDRRAVLGAAVALGGCRAGAEKAPVTLPALRSLASFPVGTCVQAVHLDDPDLQRYLRQLHIIAELRKLESFTAPIIENMPVALNITIDPYYKKGIEEGIEKGIEKGKAEGKTEATQATREEYTKRMLTKGLGITEISDLLGIDFEFVQRIAAAMNRKD